MHFLFFLYLVRGKVLNFQPLRFHISVRKISVRKKRKKNLEQTKKVLSNALKSIFAQDISMHRNLK